MFLYRDSSDTTVSSAGITEEGRRWQEAQEAVKQAEVRLRHDVLVGSVAVGQAGLGSHTRPRCDKAQRREGSSWFRGKSMQRWRGNAAAGKWQQEGGKN